MRLWLWTALLICLTAGHALAQGAPAEWPVEAPYRLVVSVPPVARRAGLNTARLDMAEQSDVCPAGGAGMFKVKLGFAALPGDRAGSRVFDVRLNGKTVLKDFDMAAEAGGENAPVIKEFTNIEADRAIQIEFVPKDGQVLTDANVPVLCGVEVVQQK